MNRTQIHPHAHAGASITKACVCFGAAQMRPELNRWSKATTRPGFPA